MEMLAHIHRSKYKNREKRSAASHQRIYANHAHRYSEKPKHSLTIVDVFNKNQRQQQNGIIMKKQQSMFRVWSINYVKKKDRLSYNSFGVMALPPKNHSIFENLID